jgi:hypothetical protein
MMQGMNKPSNEEIEKIRKEEERLLVEETLRKKGIVKSKKDIAKEKVSGIPPAMPITPEATNAKILSTLNRIERNSAPYAGGFFGGTWKMGIFGILCLIYYEIKEIDIDIPTAGSYGGSAKAIYVTPYQW